MENLRSWVLLLAGTALASAVIGALAPAGENKRAFRVLCAVVLLYAALSPLRGVSLDRLDLDALLQPDTAQETELNARAADAAVLAAEGALQTALIAAFRQAGYENMRVSVICERFDDGVAPKEILLRGGCTAETAARVLEPYLTAHTTWRLATEDEHVD